MKLIIDREKWLRGEGADDSFLLRRSDKKMCCLGFYSLACGLDVLDICQMREPLSVKEYLKDKAEWLFKEESGRIQNSPDAKSLMETNDESGNEDIISTIFAENGVEVEFIN